MFEVQPMSRYQWQRLLRQGLWALLAILAAVYGPHRGGVGWPKPNATDPAPEQISGEARAIDGDSLYVGSNEVRLKDIDAPEGRQSCQREGRDWACGDASRDELKQLIGWQTVQCRVIERDKHGRLLAYCTAGGHDLNREMVANGMAVSFGGYSGEESDAKRARRGLWGSQFERPQAWRHERGIGM